MGCLRNWNNSLRYSLMCLAFYCSNLTAGTVGSVASSEGFYLGAYGGGGYSDNEGVNQRGVALFSAQSGGPFNVVANGADSNPAGIGGAYVGYAWNAYSVGGGEVIPSAEFEGLYLGSTQSARLFHPNNRVIGHSFIDNFPMDMGMFLTNAVLTYRSAQLGRFEPYVGGGIGAVRISISNANSAQVVPPEPGINHFNSNPDASNWTMAAQPKIGLRVRFNEQWSLFGEYRLIYIASSDYIFGSTQYATHAPTTPWNVHFGSLDYNAAVAGIQFKI